MKKTICMMLAALVMAFGMPACTSVGDGWWNMLPGIEAPIVIGVRYQLEEDLFIVVETADKGGINVKLEGTGDVGKYITYVDGVYKITGPVTGTQYEVSQENGKIKVMVVAGNGDLQIYTPKKVGTAPAVVVPEK